MSEHDEKKIRITHPKHGDAQCSEHQLEEFTGLGWEAADGDAADAAEGKKGKKGKKADQAE